MTTEMHWHDCGGGLAYPHPASALHPGEVRVTDPVTGGEKGRKPAQLGTVDPLALLELAKVGGVGAVKYSRYNYLRGFAWSLGYDALQRHLLAYQSGEDVDPESGLPHLAHAMWHCSALLSFQVRGLGTDDRPPVGRPGTHTFRGGLKR